LRGSNTLAYMHSLQYTKIYEGRCLSTTGFYKIVTVNEIQLLTFATQFS